MIAFLKVLEPYPEWDKNSNDYTCIELHTGEKIRVDLFTDGHLPMDMKSERLKGSYLVADLSVFLYMGNDVRPMRDEDIELFKDWENLK